ncbi:MAG: hypothetical protein HC859_13875 [Bacteroidia bacterium]|nr:hypothetical protein [Bacteroidia bacterium]
MNIRLSSNVSAGQAIAEVRNVFERVIPSAPFEYKFVDQEYARKFASEERIGALSSVFSAFAIFISCLGLFGLSSFVVEQRTKEIGIRKVLGATVFQLWAKLSKEFLILVSAALTVSVPLAYYFTEAWLDSYHYRISFPPGVVLATATGTIAITMVTISLQTLKAAITNPVHSLRTE